MKRIALTMLAFSLVPFFASSQTSREVELTTFDKLRVTNEINVLATAGNKPSARIVAKGIDVENVIVEVKATTLEVTLKKGVYKDFSVELYLTYVELRDIFVTSSGRVSFQNALSGDKVFINASTSGAIDACLQLRSAEVSADRGGTVRLSGKVGSYEAKVSTAGNLSAFDLTVDSAFVKVNSKGIAKISATELVEANVRTGGTLTLSGQPRVKRIKTGIGATVLEQ